MTLPALARRVPACLLVAALAAIGCSRPPEKALPPPNVLLIMVDDLNTRLASYGDPIARTPNIDRLAGQGVRFDRAYVQFPLCGPSRISFLSGRYPETTQAIWNSSAPRAAIGNADLLPEHFQRHGYHTSWAGKIEHTGGTIRWSPPKKMNELAALAPRLSLASVIPLGWQVYKGDEADLPDAKVARLAAFHIEQDFDEPFFFAVGFFKPHLPFAAPERYFSNYPLYRFQLPREDPHHLDGVPPIGLTHEPTDLAMPVNRKKMAIAAYYACVEYVDAQIGKILDVMDRKGLWENTIVVLSSDHGFHLGEHLGLWRKGTLFEQSLRVPLLIAAPNVPRGGVVHEPVELVDVYPTLAELAGLPMAAGLQGRSLVSWMRDPEAANGGVAYSVVARSEPGMEGLGRSIRTRRYRYTSWDNFDAELLYDHETDPGEYVNLAAAPERAKTVMRMQRLLERKKRQAVSSGTEAGPPSPQAD